MENISIQKLKEVKRLKLKKYRSLDNKIIIEGDKILEEALINFPSYIEYLVTSDDQKKYNNGIRHYLCSKKQMSQMSSLNSASSVLAVMKSDFSYQIPTTKRFLLIDGIKDPGNLGTIIRSCDWFGINLIMCSQDTVEVFNQKVIQSSMGSIFRVKIEYKNLKEFIKNNRFNLYATTLHGEDYRKVNWSSVDGFVIGNEGNGISKEILSLIPNTITIKKRGKAESLNAAVATGILLSCWN